MTELGFVAGPKFNWTLLQEIEKGVRGKVGDDFLFENREVSETEKTSRTKHRWIVSKIW